MKSVGLHFGHDAAAAAFERDGLTRFLNKERAVRVKHALGLSADDLRGILDDDVAIGLASTQNVPIFLPEGVQLSLEGGEAIDGPAYRAEIGESHPYVRQTAWDPNYFDRAGVLVREENFYHETFANTGANASYEALGMVGHADPVLRHWHRKPGVLTLDGVERPVTFYQHHLLHAYYAAYTASPDQPALIITNDGGVGPTFHGGGIYFWNPPGELTPVVAADGWLGDFYTAVSVVCGLDPVGGPGKLMGLAPYGRPIYVDGGLVGTRRQVTQDYTLDMSTVIARWLSRAGVNVGELSNWDVWGRYPPAHVADVAASAQALLELNTLALLKAAKSIAWRARHPYENIVLCGGLALNCPANSNLAAVAGAPVLVPPAVNDEGLAIGAAVAAWIDRHGEAPAAPANFADAVYLGGSADTDEVVRVAAKRGWTGPRENEDAIAAAVTDLAAGHVVGIFSGCSEIGPRALGHRSLLADPRNAEVWARMNAIKRREPWRPFAPAVLSDQSERFFDCGPSFSPYMLFNFRCVTKELPAITHFDHSSRLQHVAPETGLLHDLLLAWSKEAVPVLMNTSFNGPGVPIVETIDDALSEAEKLGVRSILTDAGYFTFDG